MWKSSSGILLNNQSASQYHANATFRTQACQCDSVLRVKVKYSLYWRNSNTSKFGKGEADKILTGPGLGAVQGREGKNRLLQRKCPIRYPA